MLEKHIRLFNKDAENTNESIFGEHSGLLYWDEQNPVWYDVYSELKQNFWIPQEVGLNTDSRDWRDNMSDIEKTFYKRAISQLVLLDSISTVIDGQLAAYIKNPAIKAIMAYIASQESIHNESYTYIATTFMTKEEAKEVFEIPKTDKYILGSSEMILDAFETFLETPTKLNMAKALAAMAALEGIRFTNGFTPFYLLNRNKKMLGTGQIIQLIQRDEVQHSYFQTLVVRQIMSELHLSSQESEDFSNWVYAFFDKVVKSEQELARDLYKDYAVLDMEELEHYIEWRANILLQNLGLTKVYTEALTNPMIWIKTYDSDNINNTKTDFFENRVVNYSKATDDKNNWDEL